MPQALAMYRNIHLEAPVFGMRVLSDNFTPEPVVAIQSNSQRKEGVPVRCDFYTMVFCLEGGATRYVNQFELTINAHSIHLLPPESMHSFKDRFDTTRYYVLLFEKDFPAAPELQAFHDEHLESVDLEPSLFNKIKEMFEEIDAELKGTEPDRLAYVRCLLDQLLFLLKREKLKQGVETEKTRNDVICSQFLSLLELHFRTKRSVQEYAQLLDLTPKYLSETIKATMGKSALHFIHSRTVKEARYLLVYTNKTIYDIALTLGFTDASQFTKFFRQKVGTSPKQYRIEFA